MPSPTTINKEDLICQKDALSILKCDKTKLQQYVAEGTLRKIKSSRDKRYTYYSKEIIEQLAAHEEFYYE